TSCRIVAATPPSELAWDVFAPLVGKVAHWSYLIEELDERRCRVTETALDHRTGWFKLFGDVITGVKDRGDHNAANMRVTLERLKAAAEVQA
ncbi:MAG TPA: SRPBCC family protein, partial [Acidimicrobiales bacterium]|nr:SRPBCC family protein [Acidimicrobiales bacterium]